MTSDQTQNSQDTKREIQEEGKGETRLKIKEELKQKTGRR